MQLRQRPFKPPIGNGEPAGRRRASRPRLVELRGVYGRVHSGEGRADAGRLVGLIMGVSKKRPLDTLRDVAEELRAAGAPGVSVSEEGVQFDSSAVDHLMLRDRRAAELWFGEVLYWDDEVRIMCETRGKNAEKYTIAVNDGGWHIYTLTFTLRKGWEGVIYTSDPEAPRRIKRALQKLAEGTPREEVKKWEPKLREGAGTYRIRMGGWAREIFAKNLKMDKK